ncbi:hypothetical protein P3T21_007272 [Paraburkholderia sp. GAS334]
MRSSPRGRRPVRRRKSAASSRSRGAAPAVRSNAVQSFVPIHPSATFPPETPGRDHFAQKRAGPIFRIAEVPQEHICHGKKYIQSDQVRQCERPDGVIGPKAHSLVDFFGRGDTFSQQEERFVDHWHENPVNHEPGRVFDADRRLVEPYCQFANDFGGSSTGLQAANDFDERQQWDWIEEMRTVRRVWAFCRATTMER